MRRAIALLCMMSWLGPGPVAVADEAAPPAPAPMMGGLSSEARDRFVAALASLEGGDGNAAAGVFGERNWAATPLSDYALLFQAEGLLQAGNAPGARAAALRVVDGTDSRVAPSAVLRTATVLSRAGDEADAAALLRRFLARYTDHPGAAAARLALGQALLADNRSAEAARVLNDLWIQLPTAPEAVLASQQLKILADGGLGAAPPSPRERVERAEKLLGAGRADQAQSEADVLIAEGLSDDLRGRALRIVFEASRRAGRYDAARAAADKALTSLPPEARRSWLLDLAQLQKTRSRDQSLATLDRLIREYPKSKEASEALLRKGRLLEESSKAAAAQAVYRKVIDGYPDGADAATALWRTGWIDWSRGAYAEAGRSWSRLLTLRGGSAYSEAATYWLGRVDELRGEAESATRHFAKLQGEAPRSYYGILAAQRSNRATSTATPASVTLPADPLEPLRGDSAYERVEALRAVGLGVFADEEMSDMARRAAGDPALLYALSAAYVQESRYHLALRILRRHFYSLARTGGPAVPRAFWEMLYPMGWRSDLTEAASRAAVDPLLVAAVVREESSYYPQARSRVGARGLMQLMPETARPMAQARRLDMNNRDFLDDPATNLELGSAYLGRLVRDFGDARLAAAAYNAGPARVREWLEPRRPADLEAWVEQIPFDETRAFVKRVMLSWDEYRRLYGPSMAAEPAVTDAGRP